jgi:cytochrome c553
MTLLPLLVVAATAFAADTPPAGDATRGATVAATCAACHGAHGEGLPAGGFPRLAGQTAEYLAQQLRDFSNGKRNSPVMTPLAKPLDAQKIADVAAFYSAQSPPWAAATTKPDATQLARGRLLVRTGDESKWLQACANCHGPDGAGEKYATPYLAGQSATYIAAAIREWKSGARTSGDALMKPVADRLDDADIAAVAAYLESVGGPSH